MKRLIVNDESMRCMTAILDSNRIRWTSDNSLYQKPLNYYRDEKVKEMGRGYTMVCMGNRGIHVRNVSTVIILDYMRRRFGK